MKSEAIIILIGSIFCFQLLSAETPKEKCAKLNGCHCEAAKGCFIFLPNITVHNAKEAEALCEERGVRLPIFEHERAVDVSSCCGKDIYEPPYWIFAETNPNMKENCSAAIVKQKHQYEVISQCTFLNPVKVVCECPYEEE
ncbi:UNVERIFIED_CONTAM: hypothetical protein RMT77_008898 [Armadillidium vulgare]